MFLPFIYVLISFHENRSNSISFPLTPPAVHIYYLSPQQRLRMCFPLFIDVGLLLSQPVIALGLRVSQHRGRCVKLVGLRVVDIMQSNMQIPLCVVGLTLCHCKHSFANDMTEHIIFELNNVSPNGIKSIDKCFIVDCGSSSQH